MLQISELGVSVMGARVGDRPRLTFLNDSVASKALSGFLSG